MLNQLSEIAPAGALVAAAAWGGLSYFISGPELANRVARVEHLSTCEQQVTDATTRATQGAIDQTKQVSDIERQAQQARQYVDSMRSQFGEAWGAYNQLTGGALSQAVQQAEALERQAQQARAQARRLLEAQRDAALETTSDQCSCQVTAALNDSRNDWAMFAGSFGLIEQDGVTEFASLMRANSRMCADRVQS